MQNEKWQDFVSESMPSHLKHKILVSARHSLEQKQKEPLSFLYRLEFLFTGSLAVLLVLLFRNQNKALNPLLEMNEEDLYVLMQEETELLEELELFEELELLEKLEDKDFS